MSHKEKTADRLARHWRETRKENPGKAEDVLPWVAEKTGRRLPTATVEALAGAMFARLTDHAHEKFVP